MVFISNAYIQNAKDIENVKEHKFVGGGYSWLENKLNPFWSFCTDLLPFWITPNMVTLVGFFCFLLTGLIVTYYDLTMSMSLPKSIYVIIVFLMFVSQTLDNMDGKHARNTGRCSPLGQFMDHGLDSFSTVFLAAMPAQACLLGGSLLNIGVQIMMQLSFYLCNWEEHYTGVLHTHVNDVGLVEFQFIAMALSLLPLFYGTDDLKNGNAIMIFNFISLILFIYSVLVFYARLGQVIKTNEDFKNKFYHVYSFIILVVAELLTSQLNLYQSHTILIIILNGIFFGLMISKVVLCTMAKRPLEKFCYDNLVYLLVIIVCILYNNFWFEVSAIGLCALIIFTKSLHFMLSVIFTLLDYLKINF